jgi:hypothetical protein
MGDMRDYISTLGITTDNKVYCGKMPDNVTETIGIYNLKSRNSLTMPLGGWDSKSCYIKGFSILVHWNKSPVTTETKACSLYVALAKCNRVTINNKTIQFIKMLPSEPISVATDDSGIFEYVIECLVYINKERND